jgi:hypothetical protein
MINKLINLANYLDESGFKKEADRVDAIIKKSSCEGQERAWRSKWDEWHLTNQEAKARLCGEDETNFKTSICVSLIKKNNKLHNEVEALESEYKACYESNPPANSSCAREIANYNIIQKQHDDLVTRHDECLADNKEKSAYFTACKPIQIKIDKINPRLCNALLKARGACGCAPKNGWQKCKGRSDGGRFELPGTWKECREQSEGG